MTPRGRSLAVIAVPGVLSALLFTLGLSGENDDVATIGLFGLVGCVGLALVTRFGRRSKEVSDTIDAWIDGEPARARVLKLELRGGEDDPLVVLDLEVHLPDGESYRSTVCAELSRLAIPRVQPGSEIVVHVARDDRTAIAIDPALTPGGYRR